VVEKLLRLVGGAAVRAAAEEFEPVLFDLETGAACRFARDRFNPAVVHIGCGATVEADKMVMVGWLAWDVGVRSVWEVNPLYKPLLAEELQESKDRCASDPHPPPTRILQEVRGGEVTLAALNERGEFSAWAGQAHPCAI
jgi:hypothetical protein